VKSHAFRVALSGPSETQRPMGGSGRNALHGRHGNPTDDANSQYDCRAGIARVGTVDSRIHFAMMAVMDRTTDPPTDHLTGPSRRNDGPIPPPHHQCLGAKLLRAMGRPRTEGLSPRDGTLAGHHSSSSSQANGGSVTLRERRTWTTGARHGKAPGDRPAQIAFARPRRALHRGKRRASAMVAQRHRYAIEC
jgi:hypothetical protein